MLSLDQNSLTGHILESVLNCLEQLEVLSLRKKQLDGDVPFRVFTLMLKLREIWLSENKLSGEIHRNIGNIKNLTHFDVYHNHLRGEIPDDVVPLNE